MIKCENIYDELINIEPIINSMPCVHKNMELQGERKVFYISDIHCDMKRRKGFGELSDKEYINHIIERIMEMFPLEIIH